MSLDAPGIVCVTLLTQDEYQGSEADVSLTTFVPTVLNEGINLGSPKMPVGVATHPLAPLGLLFPPGTSSNLLPLTLEFDWQHPELVVSCRHRSPPLK